MGIARKQRTVLTVKALRKYFLSIRVKKSLLPSVFTDTRITTAMGTQTCKKSDFFISLMTAAEQD